MSAKVDRQHSLPSHWFLLINIVVLLLGSATIAGLGYRSQSLQEAARLKQTEIELDLEKPLRTYRWLQQRLTDNERKLDERIYGAIERVIPDENEKNEMIAVAKDLLENGGDRKSLYKRFILSKPNPDVLYSYVKGGINSVWKSVETQSMRSGARFAWKGGYLLEAAMTGYEATGQERFLTIARDAMLEMLPYRDDALDRTDDHRGRVLKAWGTNHLSEGNEYYNIATHAGRIAANMAWYAWLVNKEPALANNHSEAAAKLLQAAQDALLEFEDEYIVSNDGDYGYYWKGSQDAIEPLNHLTSLGWAHLYIAELNDNPLWSERTNQIIEFTKMSLFQDDSGMLVWNYKPRPENPQASEPEPVWKGHISVRFMIHAEKLGYGFDEGTLSDVARSINTNVFRDGKNLNSVISDSFESFDGFTHVYGGFANFVPYYILREYDVGLSKQIEEIVSTDGKFGGWLSSHKTAVSYAHRLRSAF